MPKLDDDALDLLFRKARTHNVFLADSVAPVSDDELRAIWDYARFAPTGGNTNPCRIAFVRSTEAKERLRPALAPGNVDKTMAAPATAIFAYDVEFFELMPKLFPARDMRSGFARDPAGAVEQAKFNATLQAGYFLLAARAAGLDCGPMGGFDSAKVDAAFFEGTTWRSLLLCNLGHGDHGKLYPRNPRLDFDEACRIV